MSQCVPTWDVEVEVEVEDAHHHNTTDGLLKPSQLPAAPSNSMSSNLHVPIVDYEVAELTWKNGQVAMHGLGPPRVAYKPHADTANVTWNNPRAAETLETIVNQATHCKPHKDPYAVELVPWLDHQTSTVAAGSVSASATMTMDALVPHALPSATNGDRTACSTRVGSCSSDHSGHGGGTVARECRDHSVSGSETFSSRQLTGDRELGVRGFTLTSMGSREKSTSPDEHDSVSHSRPQMKPEEKKKIKGKSSISTKRSRAAAIHNQSERRRRDKINQKMKTLQMLVPNANKTDKASILDEVIEYLKQLQAQIHMMGRMSMSPMMMTLAMQQQQLQMAMMNPMGMGIGMGMGINMPGVMDLNAIGSNRPNIPTMSPVFHPSTFMQPMIASCDIHATGDRVPNHSDPMAAFLACQSQTMTTEGYNRMVAMYQQMHNQSCHSGLKN